MRTRNWVMPLLLLGASIALISLLGTTNASALDMQAAAADSTHHRIRQGALVDTLPAIEVTDSFDRKIRRAVASSQGSVTSAELKARPIYRPAEMLETVPGVVISQHSGEGKANQYYLRGFNLDHFRHLRRRYPRQLADERARARLFGSQLSDSRARERRRVPQGHILRRGG